MVVFDDGLGLKRKGQYDCVNNIIFPSIIL